MRLVLAAFLLIVADLARTAGAACPIPDASFDAFFARFQQDSIFRLDRVEWPLRSIGTDSEGTVTRTRESRDWVLKMERAGLPLITPTISGAACFDTAPPPNRARRCSDVEYVRNDRASVVVSSPGAPGSIDWYRFRKRGGCWYLVEVEGITR